MLFSSSFLASCRASAAFAPGEILRGLTPGVMLGVMLVVGVIAGSELIALARREEYSLRSIRSLCSPK
jgi:hypothetical protein